MKRALLPVLALSVLALTACTDPIRVREDKFEAYPQVQVDSYYLQTWTRLQKPKLELTGNGQLNVDVPIRNLTDSDLAIDYQYKFLRNGALHEGPSSWHELRLPRKGVGHITFSSIRPMPQAGEGDFYLIIRERK